MDIDFFILISNRWYFVYLTELFKSMRKKMNPGVKKQNDEKNPKAPFSTKIKKVLKIQIIIKTLVKNVGSRYYFFWVSLFCQSWIIH